MYIRWCETHDYKTELVSESPAEVGGFKEVIFAVHGVDAYRMLKFEAGVHRVQRVPVYREPGPYTYSVRSRLPSCQKPKKQI